jgi:hypothetical protein
MKLGVFQLSVMAREVAVYKLGRFLQLLGLLITPVGIGGNLARQDQVDVKTSLAIAALGIIVFVAGWLLQKVAGKKG